MIRVTHDVPSPQPLPLSPISKLLAAPVLVDQAYTGSIDLSYSRQHTGSFVPRGKQNETITRSASMTTHIDVFATGRDTAAVRAITGSYDDAIWAAAQVVSADATGMSSIAVAQVTEGTFHLVPVYIPFVKIPPASPKATYSKQGFVTADAWSTGRPDRDDRFRDTSYGSWSPSSPMGPDEVARWNRGGDSIATSFLSTRLNLASMRAAVPEVKALITAKGWYDLRSGEAVTANS